MKQLVVNLIFNENIIREVSWVQDRSSSSKLEKEADPQAWWLRVWWGRPGREQTPTLPHPLQESWPWAISSIEVGFLKTCFFMKKFQKVSFSYYKISNGFSMGHCGFLASSPIWLCILPVSADLRWLLTSVVTKVMTIFLWNFIISDGLTPLF